MSTIHTIREDGQETVQRFPKYKPLIPIREVDGVVYVSGHGPENINTTSLFTGGVWVRTSRWKRGMRRRPNVQKRSCALCRSDMGALTASITWCARWRW